MPKKHPYAKLLNLLKINDLKNVAHYLVYTLCPLFWKLLCTLCPVFDYLCGMENKETKNTANAIMLFSTHLIVGESDPRHFKNPVVVNYAMNYILKAIKKNIDDISFAEHYKEVFWYIADNYKTN